MSRGQNFSTFNGSVRSALEPDVGPADGDHCSVDPCDSDAVFRVLWPSIGGDVAYCGYHLARYCEQYSDLWKRVGEAVDDNLSTYATRGTWFLIFDAVSERDPVGTCS